MYMDSKFKVNIFSLDNYFLFCFPLLFCFPVQESAGRPNHDQLWVQGAAEQVQCDLQREPAAEVPTGRNAQSASGH